MFQFLGDLITFLVLIGLGVGLLFQYKKKKKDRFLILGILMILINTGMAFNSYQKYQKREVNKRIESEQRTTESKNTALQSLSDSLSSELKIIYEQGFINGFSVAIMDDGGTLYLNGFGYANVELRSEFTENTLINIGSITKTLVGVSLLKAQELNMLELDDPINEHLPFTVQNPHYPNEQITIRHLANHTSTIIDTDYFDETCYVMVAQPDSTSTLPVEVLDYFNSPNDTLSLSSYIKRMIKEGEKGYTAEGFLAAKPGEQYQYSNIGAGVAALIIETVSGMSFREFTKKNILKPLDMESSGWKRDNLDKNRISKNYATVDTVYADYHLINYPDGGLVSSSADLSNLLIELIKGYNGNGSLLSTESFRTLFARNLTEDLFLDVGEEVIPVINIRLDKGIFMALAPKNTIGHSGSDPGVIAFMFFNSETGTGRILLMNMSVNDPNQMAFIELFDIWDKLEEYANRLQEAADNRR